MDIDLTASSNWVFDYDLMDDISAVHFPAPPTIGFSWPNPTINSSSNSSVEIDSLILGSQGHKESESRKTHNMCWCLYRVRPETFNASGSKACREKMRRDKLNERFLELSSILEPGRPPKTDKAAILNDAVRMLTQLRSEADTLKESNEELQEKIKDLKAEKHELRDEKQKIKGDKEKLEQQVKAFSAQPAFLPHPSTLRAAYSAQGQADGNKLMSFVGYPGVAMWQFMPPAVVDTTQDHVLRPPVA
ncbi:Transcription factor ILR3 [Heracleum sosnowskyi]|uniref:Transcription factor ILR3 n=1 Tax=Heracleum sosnowskyi TaxID=360622 RepID=A0AAD8MZP1_9APIA|nr:Transcription factor ILR3 [Heracleum sosnowskyi]